MPKKVNRSHFVNFTKSLKKSTKAQKAQKGKANFTFTKN